jgi:hypothetical protein
VQSWPLERSTGLLPPGPGPLDGGLLEWPSGVAQALLHRRPLGRDRLCTPDGLRRLIGRRACVEDHLRPVTGSTYDSRCWRLGSAQSSREVPAETQRSPPAPAGGRGHSGRIGVRGGRRPRGGRREPGPVWPLEVPVRGAVAHRRDPSASLPRPAPSRPERAWPFTSRHAHRPAPLEPAPVVHRDPSRASSLRSSLRDPRRWGGGALGVVEGQGELLAGSRAVLGRYVVMSSGVVKPCLMSQL